MLISPVIDVMSVPITPIITPINAPFCQPFKIDFLSFLVELFDIHICLN